MLLVDPKKVTFKKKYQKILHLTTAFNDTICFLGILGHRQDCLTHMNMAGQVLKQKIFTQNIDSFAMLSDRQVMVLQTRKNCITVWNLETDVTVNVPFNFKAP